MTNEAERRRKSNMLFVLVLVLFLILWLFLLITAAKGRRAENRVSVSDEFSSVNVAAADTLGDLL